MSTGTMADTLTIRCPDDWHAHFRDGAMLKAVAPYTAGQFARAIVMPNLVPPVTRVAAATAYRERVRAALPAEAGFTPLMTCYLTDDADPAELKRGHAEGVWVAAKLYPAHATTNSAAGVSSIDRIAPALEAMSEIGMPLLVHGEVTDPEVDIFDREAVFLERVLAPLLARHQGLRVVVEHATTAGAVDFVRAQGGRVGCTITPHHLVLNRNALLVGGIKPHLYCLPIVKTETDRLALRAAATSGDPHFFIGTDTAPHGTGAKECPCGAAGIFNAPVAMQTYARVFDEEGALERLEGFAALNGARFYGLAPNESRLRLERTAADPARERVWVEGADPVTVFRGGEALGWRVTREAA